MGATAKRGRPTRKSDMGVCPRDIPRRLVNPRRASNDTDARLAVCRRQCALRSRAARFAGSRLRPRAEHGSGKRSGRRQKLPARMAESPCRELVQRTRQRQSNRRTTPAGKTCRSGNPWHCGPDAMTRSPRMTRRRKSFRSNSGRPPMRPATVGRRTIVAGAHNQEASATPYRQTVIA